MKREKSAKGLGRAIPLLQLDTAAVIRARSIFDDYRSRGIILGNSFDDPEWRLSNEASNVTLTTLSFGDSAETEPQDWLGVDPIRYAACLKAYIVLKFGNFALTSLRSITNALSALPNRTADEASGITHNAAHIAEFLSLLPNATPERDEVEAILDERVQAYKQSRGVTSRRVLAAFNSYLRFNETLSEFWKFASEDVRLFYFPVYFWWNLTAILPLRPTEFLLTPRDCLDGNFLTVRRTKLKGSGGRVSYRIAHDYELHRYEITPSLAAELHGYIELTENMPPTEIDTLFRLDSHYDRLRMGVAERNRYYTYANMRTCLSMLLSEPSISEEVGSIHLGDTRHLAMIGLIISGGSPTVCKDLAGHADIGVASHYYSNISTIEESVALARFRKSKAKSAEFAGEPVYPLTRPDNMTRLTDGWCDSDVLKNNEVGDCMKIVDAGGRIGECSTCPHFWPDTPGTRLKFFDVNAGKRRVDLDSAFLMRMIGLVRRGLGYEEDITAALLRLQQSCNHFGDCLTMKYLNTEVM